MAKAIKAHFDTKGLKELDRKLRGLGPKFYQQVTKKALVKGGAVIVKAARANIKTVQGGIEGEYLPTGMLRKSLGTVFRQYPAKHLGLVVIGARWGKQFKSAVWQSSREHIPAKIAHLVEYGHGGLRPAPAHPFLRPAWYTKQPTAMAVISGAAEKFFKKIRP